MIVFIDDSGDPGFKFEKGSTSHFVIGMVIFDDELDAEKTAVAIKELKRDIGFSSNKKQPSRGLVSDHVPRLVSQPRHHPVTVRNTGLCITILTQKWLKIN